MINKKIKQQKQQAVTSNSMPIKWTTWKKWTNS